MVNLLNTGRQREAGMWDVFETLNYYSFAARPNVCDSSLTMQHNVLRCSLLELQHTAELLIPRAPRLNHRCVTEASARSRTHGFVLCLRQSKGDRDDTTTRVTQPFKLGIKH